MQNLNEEELAYIKELLSFRLITLGKEVTSIAVNEEAMIQDILRKLEK